MARRYWVIGDTGADLGANGSEDGYTLARARREAAEWRDATDGRVQIVPVRASYRAQAHYRHLRRTRFEDGVEEFEEASGA